jgi:hypothetical protein
MHLSLRCKAKSKRSGKQCRSPAVSGKKVCRMHGARAGAPKGKANGAYRHGMQTQEKQIERKQWRSWLGAARAVIDGAE